MDPSVHPHGAPSAGRADPTPFTLVKLLIVGVIDVGRPTDATPPDPDHGATWTSVCLHALQYILS